MLAEVLYRIAKRRLCITAALAVLLAMTGCKWDGQTVPEFEPTPTAETTAEEDTVSGAETEDSPEEEPSAEERAKAVFEGWLDTLAAGDAEAAETVLARRLGAVEADYRLFNTDFPGEADVVYYAPPVIEESGSSTLVTLKATVIPKNEDFGKVSADVIVRLKADGEEQIEFIAEVGSNAMKERRLFRKAQTVYDAAVKEFAEIKPVPYDGIHHMGEGSDLTEFIEDKFKPSRAEYYYIAVRDGKIMYVCWCDDRLAQRYPKAPEVDGLIELESDMKIEHLDR